MLNARSTDLIKLLRSGKQHIRNGNHDINITNTQLRPDTAYCEGCDHHLACYAGHQPDPFITEEEHRPCSEKGKGRFFEFSYHGTVCLIYDALNQRVTDLGMWGYSVTTSRAISQYLDAVADHCPGAYHLTQARQQKIKKEFKERTHVGERGRKPLIPILGTNAAMWGWVNITEKP